MNWREREREYMPNKVGDLLVLILQNIPNSMFFSRYTYVLVWFGRGEGRGGFPVRETMKLKGRRPDSSLIGRWRLSRSTPHEAPHTESSRKLFANNVGLGDGVRAYTNNISYTYPVDQAGHFLGFTLQRPKTSLCMCYVLYSIKQKPHK